MPECTIGRPRRWPGCGWPPGGRNGVAWSARCRNAIARYTTPILSGNFTCRSRWRTSAGPRDKEGFVGGEQIVVASAHAGADHRSTWQEIPAGIAFVIDQIRPQSAPIRQPPATIEKIARYYSAVFGIEKAIWQMIDLEIASHLAAVNSTSASIGIRLMPLLPSRMLPHDSFALRPDRADGPKAGDDDPQAPFAATLAAQTAAACSAELLRVGCRGPTHWAGRRRGGIEGHGLFRNGAEKTDEYVDIRARIASGIEKSGQV